MNALRACMTPMVVLSLVACSGPQEEDAGGRTPYENMDMAADTSKAYETGAADPVTPVQGGATVAGPLTAAGQFQSATGSAPPGSVTVTEAGSGSRISILINRYTANAELRASIVSGTCESPGAVVQEIASPIRIGEDGVGTLNAEVPVPTQTLLNGQHAVRLTAGGGGGGSAGGAVGCASLPAAQ